MAKFCTCCKYNTESPPSLDFQERGAERYIATVFSTALTGKMNSGIKNSYTAVPFALEHQYAKFGKVTIEAKANGTGGVGNGSDTWAGDIDPVIPNTIVLDIVDMQISIDEKFKLPTHAARKFSYNCSFDIDSFAERTDDTTTTGAFFKDNGTDSGILVATCVSPPYKKTKLEFTRSHSKNGVAVPQPITFFFDDPAAFGPCQIRNTQLTVIATPLDKWTSRSASSVPASGRPNWVDPAFVCGDAVWTIDEAISTVTLPGYGMTPGNSLSIDEPSVAVAGAGFTADVSALSDMGTGGFKFPKASAVVGTASLLASEMITAEETMTEIETVITAEAFGVDGVSGVVIDNNTLPAGFSPVFYKRVHQRTVSGTTHKNWLDTVEGFEKKVRFEIPADHIANGGTFFEIEYEFLTQEWSLDPAVPAVTETPTAPASVTWNPMATGDFTDWVTLPAPPAGKNVLIGVRAIRYKPHAKSLWFDI